jgi:hypothetical protein
VVGAERAILAQDLTKRYGETLALDGLDLDIRPGGGDGPTSRCRAGRIGFRRRDLLGA